MRPLSDFDKKFVNKLIEVYNQGGLVVLGNIIEDFLPQHLYIKAESTESCYIMFQAEFFNTNKDKDSIWWQEEIQDINFKISSILKLLTNLEKEDFINLVEVGEFVELGFVRADQKYIEMDIVDMGIKQTLLKFSKTQFIPTQSLTKLVANNFLDDEQIKTREQLKQSKKQLKHSIRTLKWTARGVIISAVLGLITAIVDVTSSCNVQQVQISTNKSDPVVVKIIPDKPLRGDTLKIIKKDTLSQVVNRDSQQINKNLIDSNKPK